MKRVTIRYYLIIKWLVLLLNCPYCDSEIDNEDDNCCSKCGKSFEIESEPEQISKVVPMKQTDLLLASGLLAMVSAAFIASIGYLGIYQYLALVDYYGSTLASEFFGFLIFGIIGILCAVFAIVGSVFILKRKNLKISIFGFIFPLVSVIATFIVIVQYQYGFTENTIIFSEVSVFILSILCGALIYTSRDEFK